MVTSGEQLEESAGQKEPRLLRDKASPADFLKNIFERVVSTVKAEWWPDLTSLKKEKEIKLCYKKNLKCIQQYITRVYILYPSSMTLKK